jgi:hypothetical protein
MILTPIDPPSSNIYAEGFDPETCLLYVQFKDKDKPKPEAYEFDGLSPEFYEELKSTPGQSFGKMFALNIKPFPKKFPFKKVPLPVSIIDQVENRFQERKREVERAADMEHYFPPAEDQGATDFTATGPVPAVLAPSEIVIPEDPEALKQEALALSRRAEAIEITSPEAYELAATTVLAITRMRDALETTFRPEIKEKHEIWKAALAVLNYYDQPLESDAKRLKDGMAQFYQQEQLRAQEEARRLQEEQDKQAQIEADARAQELQIQDAVAAEERGEPELAAVIMNSKPLPVAPMYRAPVQVMSAAPRKTAGSSYIPKWVGVVENAALIPRKYLIPDDKAIQAEAKGLQERAEIPGVRFYDAGNIRTSRKG